MAQNNHWATGQGLELVAFLVTPHNQPIDVIGSHL